LPETPGSVVVSPFSVVPAMPVPLTWMTWFGSERAKASMKPPVVSVRV
jgi:hypothetical protein